MTQGSSFTLMWERVYWQRPLGLSKLSLFVFEEQEEGQCDRSMAKGQCVGDERDLVTGHCSECRQGVTGRRVEGAGGDSERSPAAPGLCSGLGA